MCISISKLGKWRCIVVCRDTLPLFWLSANDTSERPQNLHWVPVWWTVHLWHKDPEDVVYSCWANAIRPMIFLTSTNHGCVYTLSQEDGDELYFAPIYANGTINLEEFAPVDMDGVDMDEMEVYDIRNRLVAMSNIWTGTRGLTRPPPSVKFKSFTTQPNNGNPLSHRLRTSWSLRG